MRYLLFSLFVVTLIQLIKSDGCEDTKPDFSAPGRRISEQKCHEYNWEISQLDKCSKDAENTEYPYMGSLGYRKQDKLSFLCGAFLISPQFALTAGHCINTPASVGIPEIIRFGNRDLDVNEPHVDAKIRRTIVHPEFKPPNKENDIALVQLETAVPFTKSLSPACLWSQATLAGVEDVFYAGWLRRSTGAAGKKEVITELKIKIMESEICLGLLKKSNILRLHDSQICVNESISGVPDKVTSGGGPIINQVNLNGNREDQMPYAVGVASFGDTRGTFGIYTSIYSYIDWIEKTVWE